jgi:hypothetical protein
MSCVLLSRMCLNGRKPTLAFKARNARETQELCKGRRLLVDLRSQKCTPRYDQGLALDQNRECRSADSSLLSM